MDDRQSVVSTRIRMRSAMRAQTALLLLLLLVAFGLLPGAQGTAAPLRLDQVPGPLAPWIDWVLHRHEAERCPMLLGPQALRACVWPSELVLELGPREGYFTQRWHAARRLFVALPGDSKHWPEEVEVDGTRVPVVERDGRPGLELSAGEHEASGVLRWDARPEILQIPPETALVRLTLVEGDGAQRPIRFPRRDATGRLWLRTGKAGEGEGQGEAEQSRLEAKVFRRIVDEVPLILETRIDLEVSGRPREVLLGRALPDDFSPMSLAGPIPARIDPDGRLRLQVRPGHWRLDLVARHRGPVERLVRPKPNGPWAKDEIWAFEARPQLRLVTIENGIAVDPQQTGLPAEWSGLPAYLMKPGTALELREKRRGDSDSAPDELQLERNWWLDFDGRGYTVSDRIEGEIRRSARLDMQPSIALGRVSVNGRDQFITRLGEGQAVGIEVPRGRVEISADSRVERERAGLAAVGWMHDFQKLHGQLHLPPGWRLLHASGVDRARSTWVNRWTLLDIFAVLVMAMASYRLWGPRWGIVAGLALLLSFTEPAAPRWVWAGVLVTEALRRVLPAGRMAGAVTIGRGLALFALIAIALPFAVTEIRVSLHPALESPGSALRERTSAPAAQGEEKDAVQGRGGKRERVARGRRGRLEKRLTQGLAEVEAPVPALAKLPVRRMPESFASSSPLLADEYTPDPAARVTTGPGLPIWRWNRVELEWNGPVDASQALHLVLLPPVLTGFLGFLRVGLLAALVLCVFGRAGRLRFGRRGASGPVVLLALGFALSPLPARADFPPDSLLEELRARLLEAPECAPACASSPRMRLEASERRMTLRLEVDVVVETAVPLPGGPRSWVPQRVSVDSRPARGLRRDADGTLWLLLAAGRHEVLLAGGLPERDSLDLPLPLRPHRVEARLQGWTLHGLHEDGLVEQTLQLSRTGDVERVRGTAGDASILPPFVRVVRELRLGLRWQMQTRVERMTPVDAAVVLQIPLWPGERVTASELRVEKGLVQIGLPPGKKSVSWSSVLDQSAELGLRATDQNDWIEVWRLDASPIWHVEAEGIPVVHSASAAGARVREWRPWPGESVRLQVSRPDGVEGPTLTIDASRMRVRPGLRATEVDLDLVLRSSRGGEHTVQLPAGASLSSVSISGERQPIRLEGRALRLPLVPGSERVQIAWREQRGIGWHFETSRVDLGTSSVNAQLQVVMPQGRWTLLANGPRVGPSVLFWSFLLVVVLIALALGRISLTPLRFHHWFLLGIGLSQASLWAAGTVVVWLLLLGWRAQHGTRLGVRRFDALQCLLVGLSVAALAALFLSIRQGLLGTPEMQIAGGGSSAQLLRWYQDRAGDQLARSSVFSVPLWVYRLAMLAWALWLAQALLRWLGWAWACFGRDRLWLPLGGRRRGAEPSRRRAEGPEGESGPERR